MCIILLRADFDSEHYHLWRKSILPTAQMYNRIIGSMLGPVDLLTCPNKFKSDFQALIDTQKLVPLGEIVTYVHVS